MMRILIVFVFGSGVSRCLWGTRDNKKRGSKKEKAEEWIGVMGGLSQFYLKDELGSYLRFEGQTRSIALTGLTEKLKSYHWGFGVFGIGKLHTSYASVDLMYLQSEFFYGRYLSSYFKEVRVSIMQWKYIAKGMPIRVSVSIRRGFRYDFESESVAGDYRLNGHHLSRVAISAYNNIYHVGNASFTQ